MCGFVLGVVVAAFWYGLIIVAMVCGLYFSVIRFVLVWCFVIVSFAVFVIDCCLCMRVFLIWLVGVSGFFVCGVNYWWCG